MSIRALRSSVEYAFTNPDASREYVAAHAQEMDPAVVAQHIRLYVNDYTLALDERAVCLNNCEHPEFDCWRWVNYWHPLGEVVAFKRKVYQRALHEFAPLVLPEGASPAPRARFPRLR